MHTYSTPTPPDLAIDLQVGMVEVIATDRTNTIVTISPTNSARLADRRGAEETTVEFDGTRVTIVGPRPRLNWIGPTESVDVKVELPTGSRLTALLAVGPFRSSGLLGATRVKSSTGGVDIAGTGDLWLRAGHGNVTVASTEGATEITADHGQIRIGSVLGGAVLKASHGSISVGECGGDLEAKLSYGDLQIEKALGSVAGTTAYGSITVGEVSTGSIQLETAFGPVSVGVRPGVPAWLDLDSKEGRVRNQLGAEGAPDDSEQTVAVRARTRFGDIDIRRAAHN